MSTNERDTHFAGFAKLVWQKLLDKNHGYIDIRGNFGEEEEVAAYELLLAQVAYDLAWHVLKTAEEHDLFADNFYGRFSLDTEAKLAEIPDLAEWPKPD